MVKMADQGRPDFYVVSTISLCTFELKQTLRPILLIVRAISDKINRFVNKIREVHTVPKQELAYNSRNSNKAKKLPTYSDQSVDRSEKQRCLKTLLCT